MRGDPGRSPGPLNHSYDDEGRGIQTVDAQQALTLCQGSPSICCPVSPGVRTRYIWFRCQVPWQLSHTALVSIVMCGKNNVRQTLY